jgi:hypothetical protein
LLLARVPRSAQALGLAMGLFVASAPARAQEAPRDAGSNVEAASEAPIAGAKPERKKRRAFRALGARSLGEFGSIQLGGRVFARAVLSRHYESVALDNGVIEEKRIDALDFTIPTARVDLRNSSSRNDRS